ncbi:MAG: glycosyltransferase family 39 protein [Chloroflexi bacterium]|nr:glycosyltransferase family 39 protein [Chloroflexota bacterium]
MTLNREFPTSFWQKHQSAILRGLLLGLILLAFARVVWRLDGKDLWWDESLSLQRAEESWGALVRGSLVMHDGFSELATTDQHPFFFFLLQGILIRLAGNDEFVLRFPSVMAATLLVPALWAFARYFVRRAVLPPSTPLWVALLAAVNPFFLWYGQEARPYALWALLAVLSTYLLLRATETPLFSPRRFMAYGVAVVLFLATHYFAVFLLPVHALLLYLWLAAHKRTQALLLALGLLILGGLIGGWAAWSILGQGAGGNFHAVSLATLAPDLLNAFSLGLSVNIDDVRWLDWIYGLVALVGLGWSLRSRSTFARNGWLLPVWIVVCVAIILLLNLFQPAYMNARHLSLLSGAFILLVGGGLGLLWSKQKLFTVGLALLLVAGAGYSTRNYFTLPEKYGNDDYSGMGHYLDENLLPGDLLLISPPFSWRIFDYYLPTAKLEAAAQAGLGTAHYGMPLLRNSWDNTFAQLARFQKQYQRIWLARSGTHPYVDPESKVNKWFRENNRNAILIREVKFHSPTSFLDLELYVPVSGVVFDGIPPGITHPLDAAFGDQIRVVGYDVGQPIAAGNSLPVTIYWQKLHKRTEDRYKYILQVLETQADGQTRVVGVTEREPYNEAVRTSYWDPGKTIKEYIEVVPIATLDLQHSERYQLSLQLYHSETLAKLPVTQSVGATVAADKQMLLFPYLPK